VRAQVALIRAGAHPSSPGEPPRVVCVFLLFRSKALPFCPFDFKNAEKKRTPCSLYGTGTYTSDDGDLDEVRTLRPKTTQPALDALHRARHSIHPCTLQLCTPRAEFHALCES